MTRYRTYGTSHRKCGVRGAPSGLQSALPASRVPLHRELAVKRSMPELWELRATRPFFAPLTFAGHIPSSKQTQCLVALQARLYA